MTTHMGHLSYGSHYQGNIITTIYGPAHVVKPSIERKIIMKKTTKTITVLIVVLLVNYAISFLNARELPKHNDK